MSMIDTTVRYMVGGEIVTVQGSPFIRAEFITKYIHINIHIQILNLQSCPLA